eukprot:TRINITY_DN11499_c0_g2_i1.p1 TRINITY_DN11499_c0_g2~~TRINITY_DN11499_c0_g2_i1.p1  ORF type:complete len:372 (-),score=64.56 TRINITY_DN11499_c0_g2_i1:101-1216(-)
MFASVGSRSAMDALLASLEQGSFGGVPFSFLLGAGDEDDEPEGPAPGCEPMPGALAAPAAKSKFQLLVAEMEESIVAALPPGGIAGASQVQPWMMPAEGLFGDPLAATCSAEGRGCVISQSALESVNTVKKVVSVACANAAAAQPRQTIGKGRPQAENDLAMATPARCLASSAGAASVQKPESPQSNASNAKEAASVASQAETALTVEIPARCSPSVPEGSVQTQASPPSTSADSILPAPAVFFKLAGPKRPRIDVAIPDSSKRCWETPGLQASVHPVKIKCDRQPADRSQSPSPKRNRGPGYRRRRRAIAAAIAAGAAAKASLDRMLGEPLKVAQPAHCLLQEAGSCESIEFEKHLASASIAMLQAKETL